MAWRRLPVPDFKATEHDEAMRAKGRYGIVSQTGTGDLSPYWYGKVIEVHPSGDYLKFVRREGAGRWYHRRDVSLHPEPTAGVTASGQQPVPPADADGGRNEV